MFHHIVNQTLSRFQIPPKELARAIGVGVSTVERWVRGTTQPHPYLRPAVYEALIALIRRRSDG